MSGEVQWAAVYDVLFVRDGVQWWETASTELMDEPHVRTLAAHMLADTRNYRNVRLLRRELPEWEVVEP